MKLTIVLALAALALPSAALAEPFKGTTVGIPVSSILDAEEWYKNLLGSDVEIIKPAPGVIEYKVSPDTWLQIFEGEGSSDNGAVLRFEVEDLATLKESLSGAGIDIGQLEEVPGVVKYTEFEDPDGNQLGFYEIPKTE